MIEITQTLGHMRVVESDNAIQIGFYRRELSPPLHPLEARALAKMLNAAARRVEGHAKSRRTANADIDAKMRIAPRIGIDRSLQGLPPGTYDTVIEDDESGNPIMKLAP